MLRLVSTLLLVVLASIPAKADVVVLYEQTTTAHRLTVPTLKALPEGYHHWREVPRELQTPVLADGSVLCTSLTTAISYAKRLAMGYRPSDAVRVMASAWGGTAVCGFTEGLRLVPELYARRGDDRGERMEVVKWRDQYGNHHFTGWPKDR